VSNDINIYEVGGCVRDEILGIPTKDIDYTVEASSFSAMREWLVDAGFDIFVESPQFLTIRARFPKGKRDFAGRDVTHLTADFVLARAEGEYTDGRHPDEVRPGTLMEDLARRDFTVNAMAKDKHGLLIDPFDGMRDLQNGVLRAVGRAEDRLREDPLRAMRAIRFAVTKGFQLHADVATALDSSWLPPLLASVSGERRREELLKAFKHDTIKTLWWLGRFMVLQEDMFADGLWLKPTMEQ
jgi:tRNA nucleotidyltransferase (CCA-adding enzyme)